MAYDQYFKKKKHSLLLYSVAASVLIILVYAIMLDTPIAFPRG